MFLFQCSSIKQVNLYFSQFSDNPSSFQISKDEFNKIAKELLGDTNIHVHNEFVLALLLKCQQTHRGFKRGIVI